MSEQWIKAAAREADHARNRVTNRGLPAERFRAEVEEIIARHAAPMMEQGYCGHPVPNWEGQAMKCVHPIPCPRHPQDDKARADHAEEETLKAMARAEQAEARCAKLEAELSHCAQLFVAANGTIVKLENAVELGRTYFHSTGFDHEVEPDDVQWRAGQAFAEALVALDSDAVEKGNPQADISKLNGQGAHGGHESD